MKYLETTVRLTSDFATEQDLNDYLKKQGFRIIDGRQSKYSTSPEGVLRIEYSESVPSNGFMGLLGINEPQNPKLGLFHNGKFTEAIFPLKAGAYVWVTTAGVEEPFIDVG